MSANQFASEQYDEKNDERRLNATAVADRALVVDDDQGICEVIELTLNRVGCEVRTVSSGAEAIEIFAEFAPDLIVSDWKMPGMDGIELITKLKTTDPHLVTILMTGFGTKEMVVEAFTRGKINYYLPKPFKAAELLEVVSAALKERRMRLSELRFRERLENEIQRATHELEDKNRLLQQKHSETELLYRELQTRQEEVEGTKNYLESLIESSVDGIISVTGDQIVSFFSRGAEEMFGFRAGQVLGRHVGFLFQSGDDLDRMFELLSRSKRIQHFECELIRADGGALVADISVSMIRGVMGRDGILLIIKDIADQKRLEAELRSSNAVLEQLSITDGLTGLYNHRHFQACLIDEFQRTKRFQTPISLIMLDLDDFKQVNDAYGHQVGDRVLQLLSEIIIECVREVDTPARYGGEEFAVILPQTDLDNAVVVADRLKVAIEESPHFKEIRPGIGITASLGLAGWPDPGVRSPQDLIRFADKALYRAKNIGKNRVVIGSSSGETPLGRGERLTQAEKKIILRRVGDTLRGMLDLDAVLQYLLGEIAHTVKQSDSEPPCAIMLMDDNRGLQSLAERNGEEQRRQDFDISAHLALEKKAFHIFREGEAHGPVVSCPITVEWPGRGEEVLGIINVGLVPTDLDFLRDITRHAALAIMNAKLYHEAATAKASLEVKVNQLMTLSLMGMALQRNALQYRDYREENKKLLARCLTQIGMERAFVYDLDVKHNMLASGVDNSLRGDNAPASLSLEESGRDLPPSIIKKVLSSESSVYIVRAKDLSRKERSLLEGLGLGGRSLALAKLSAGDENQGIVFAIKTDMTEEEAGVLSTFVLHASLIMENLALAEGYREKSRRLALAQEVGQKLALASTPAERARASGEALRGLIDVLQANEISVYAFDRKSELLELVSYTSATAGPAGEPVGRTKVGQSPLMAMVLEASVEPEKGEALILNDVRAELGRKYRKRYATNGYMGIPLVAGGRLLGVMNITDKIENSAFTPADKEVARITAGMMASVLHHFANFRELEANSLQSLKNLADLLDRGAKAPYKGHTRRVAELAEGLADLMGLDSALAASASRIIWLGLLDPKKDESPVNSDAEKNEVIKGWLRGLPCLQVDQQNGADTGAGLRQLTELRKIADFFDLAFLGLPAGKRPDLSNLLFEMIETIKSGLDGEAIKALLKGLIHGRLRRNGRRVVTDRKVFGSLVQKLGSRGSTEAETYIAFIREELKKSGHGQ